MPLDMESSRLFRLLARLSRPCQVKKLMALSSAELTFWPEASLFSVWLIKSEVCCNCSRFERTPAERTMSDILCTPLRFSLFDVLAREQALFATADKPVVQAGQTLAASTSNREKRKGVHKMSDIVLSAGVRSNLLQLQQTSDLINQTENRLASGQ